MRKIALILFSMMILIMSWEGQKIDTAAAGVGRGFGADVGSGLIPDQAIRLRILANSDGVSDQAVKRRVRDAVVEQMNGWVSQLNNPQSLEEARQVISSNLDAVEEQVEETLRQSGKDYGFKVELGKVPFPTKLYGGKVYPAGEYEALRVTLGEGKGKNWWCVLFPPLCFVDAGSGDAIASNKDTAIETAAAAVGASEVDINTEVQPEKAEVRFFLWDMLSNLWDWIVGLFK